jgi:hypothetical protein
MKNINIIARIGTLFLWTIFMSIVFGLLQFFVVQLHIEPQQSLLTSIAATFFFVSYVLVICTVVSFLIVLPLWSLIPWHSSLLSFAAGGAVLGAVCGGVGLIAFQYQGSTISVIRILMLTAVAGAVSAGIVWQIAAGRPTQPTANS